MRTLASSAIGVLMTSTAFADDIQARQVSFQNEGSTLIGTHCLLADHQPGERLPGVVVAGAWTSMSRGARHRENHR